MWFLPCYIKCLNAIRFDARLWFNAEDGFAIGYLVLFCILLQN